MAPQPSRQVNYILGAALASKRFCELLLTNPEGAINEGFQGFVFELSDEERNLIIRSTKGAQTVTDFANHLLMEDRISPIPEAQYYESNGNGPVSSNGYKTNNGHPNKNIQTLKPDWTVP